MGLRLFCATLAVGVSCTAAADARPNLVFVIADDCTAADIGCYGGQAHTPNIDRLASEGIRLTRCFQAAPMCSPTRHNLYTGLYPVKSGAYPNHTRVYDGVKSVVHYLRPLGYRVALNGKTHIGPRQSFPFEYSKHPESGGVDLTAVDAFVAECVASDTPFCQFVCSKEPHGPWTKGDPSRYPPSELRLPEYFVDTPATREAFSRYLAEITYYDGQVGGVLDLLKEHGVEEETLVMVVSEQGNSFPFAKWTCYDAGLHSAMVVRWPGQIRPGAESDALVEYVDVLPTFLELAGGESPEELDGRSLAPVLLGEADHHKRYVYGLQTSRGITAGPRHYGIRSIRSDRYRLIWNLEHESEFYNGVGKSDYFGEWMGRATAGDPDAVRLVSRYFRRPEWELYDVATDPDQLNDLAGVSAHAEAESELRTQLKAWMAEQGDEGHATEMNALKRMGNPKRRASRLDAWERKRPTWPTEREARHPGSVR